jgi:deoxyadenosine/deoxycytidine kinase
LKSIARPIQRAIVADYTSRKDTLFARLLLNDRELRLFNRLAALASFSITEPDLIVYLDAKTNILLERIRRRGRLYEDTIDASYLDALRRAYDEDLMHGGGLNVLRYDTSALDLNSETQMRDLYDAIIAAVPDSQTTS